jgi:copper transport protein
VWVGGLGSLVLLGGRAGRHLDRPDRTRLAAAAIPRFSRVAIWGVAIVIATGSLNAVIGLESVSDLWKVTYGRVILAKIVMLLVALALAARHLLVTPRRLADERGDAATTSFGRTAVLELCALTAAVALAAGLVALVPGRSLALQAGGSVAQEHRAGGYTIQVFADPGSAGANDIHITFVNPQGLGAAEIATAEATVGSSGSAARAMSLRLLSPGHFVATTELAAGRQVVIVSAAAGGTKIGSTFHLTIHAKG